MSVTHYKFSNPPKTESHFVYPGLALFTFHVSDASGYLVLVLDGVTEVTWLRCMCLPFPGCNRRPQAAGMYSITCHCLQSVHDLISIIYM